MPSDDDLLSEYGLSAPASTPSDSSGSSSSSSDDSKKKPDRGRLYVSPAKKVKSDDDSLLEEYGLDKPADNAEEVKSSGDWWKNANDDHSYTGVAKRFGIGLICGAKDVIDTGAHGLMNASEAVGSQVLPADMQQKLVDYNNQVRAQDLAARNDFNANYPPSGALVPNATDVGRVAGQIAASAPVMPGMSGISAATGALPTIGSTGARMAAPLAARMGNAAIQGGIGGGVLGATTASTNDDSLASNVGKGALLGATTAPLLPVAAAGAKAAGSLIGGAISPEKAALARTAIGKYGIDLTGPMISENTFFKKLDQVTGWLPLSGASAINAKTTGQFTRAISRTFGEDEPNITSTVLRQARQRIGNDYETVGRNSTLNADNRYSSDLAKVYQQADLMLNDQQMAQFTRHLHDLADKFNYGTMRGDVWQHTRRASEPLSKAINNNAGTDLGDALKGLKVATDQLLQRSAPADMRPLLAQADRQWANMKTVEKLAQSDAEGHVSPLKLMSKVVNSKIGKDNAGDLGELADIGRAFFHKPADSGTPLGEMIASKVEHLGAPFTAAANLASHAATGGFIPGTAELAAGAVVNRALRTGINSNVVRDAIINRSSGASHGLTDDIASAIAPYTSEAFKGRPQEKNGRLYVSGKLPVRSQE